MVLPKSEYKARMDNARKALEKKGLEAMLVTRESNIRYLTGCDCGRVFISLNDAVHWTALVYSDLLENSPIPLAEVEKEEIKSFLLKSKYPKIGIDEVPFSSMQDLKKKIKKKIEVVEIIEDLRKIKSKAEIELLEKSARIALLAMRKAESMDPVGMTELELAAEIEYEIRKNGSESTPFGSGIICLSGKNTKYIHAFPSEKKIQDGDLLVLDMGAVYNGYNSDMTRTLEIGGVGKEEREIAEFTKNLKEEALDGIEVGGKISEIHKFIEDKIKKKGHKFYHLSGHGVGLEIHEKPSISPQKLDVFQKGMAFTIEPGIYTKSFGARSEDTIILDNKKKVVTS